MTRRKTLIAFYSLQGCTREVNKAIQQATGADLFEIEMSKPYNVATAFTTALVHSRDQYTPSLKELVPNIDDYETIFIGALIWNYTLIPPIRTFF